jgi:hypothetical protein
MGYTDVTLGHRSRRGSTGPLGSLKGKPTDKMKTSGKAAAPDLQSPKGLGGGGGARVRRKK